MLEIALWWDNICLNLPLIFSNSLYVDFWPFVVLIRCSSLDFGSTMLKTNFRQKFHGAFLCIFSLPFISLVLSGRRKKNRVWYNAIDLSPSWLYSFILLLFLWYVAILCRLFLPWLVWYVAILFRSLTIVELKKEEKDKITRKLIHKIDVVVIDRITYIIMIMILNWNL